MAAITNVTEPPKRQTRREEVVIAVEDRRDTVLRVIRSARERLILSVFRCSDYLIIDELAEALRRKVRVEAILTPRVKTMEQKRLQELGAVLHGMGAEVYRYSDPVVKYHAKYMVADDGPALVSSLNFTAKCFSTTCDFQVVTYDPEVVSGLVRLFESDSVSPDSPLPEDLTNRLIVGPDRARAQLTALLRQATRSIRIIDHKIADPSIVAELKAKKTAGVSVDVLGSGQLGGLRSHGKMILIDESVAVIGSIALSPLHMDFRREVAIIVRDPRCLEQLNGFFTSILTAKDRADAQPAGDDADSEDED